MRNFGAIFAPPPGRERPPGASGAGRVLLVAVAVIVFGSLVASIEVALDEADVPRLLVPIFALFIAGRIAMIPAALLGGAALVLMRGERGGAIPLAAINAFAAVWTLGFLAEILAESTAIEPLTVLAGFVGVVELLAAAFLLWCFYRPAARRRMAGI